ncbi:MAG: BirA family biotin operon repressor/biotin-[acetyl-CoA-carboxylase] ligase [Alphaproteobacteria bacterium]|jgi:BirA family biotin operon repressor/biotin-[acetyl-CoA-carboxylase] ligase
MQVFQFDAVASTMTKAQDLAKQCYDPMFCVLAKQQTEGKGTHGRVWESPIGNYYVTYCLQQSNVCHLPQISIIVGISVAQALQHYDIDISLKWTNDLMVHRKKVGGILCVIQNNMILVGLGINFKVNPLISDSNNFFQTDYICKNLEISYLEFSKLLGCQLLLNLKAFSSNGFSEFMAYWQNYGAFYNQQISIELPDGSIKIGIDKGINTDGCLLLETQNGIEWFHSARIIGAASK